MQCPDCKARLFVNATRCACGWNAQSPNQPLPKANCAHEECGFHAFVKVRTKTGWAKLCEKHYVEDHKKEAIERCLDMGLATPKACYEWFKSHPLMPKRFGNV